MASCGCLELEEPQWRFTFLILLIRQRCPERDGDFAEATQPAVTKPALGWPSEPSLPWSCVGVHRRPTAQILMATPVSSSPGCLNLVNVSAVLTVF